MRISDWSSDVCSSDLIKSGDERAVGGEADCRHKALAKRTMSTDSPLAVALVSGGLDSMVAAARAKENGYILLALSIDYNQRHQVKLSASRRNAGILAAERHVVRTLHLPGVGGGGS